VIVWRSFRTLLTLYNFRLDISLEVVAERDEANGFQKPNFAAFMLERFRLDLKSNSLTEPSSRPR
jgi:hypothetical protein